MARTDPASARRADALGVYGTKEAAEFLGDVTLELAVRRAHRRGDLRSSLVAGRLRFDKRVLVEWYADAAVQTAFDMGPGGVTTC